MSVLPGKFHFVFTVIFFFFVVSIPSAWSAGRGFYIDAGSGSGEWDVGTGSSDYDASLDTSHFGIGYAFDTRLATKAFFNYRLGIGYESLFVKADRGPDFDYHGIAVMNDFGLGIVRRPAARVWLGPCVKAAYYVGETDNHDDTTLFLFGFGPAAGLNVKLSADTFFITKLGYIITVNMGGGDTGDIWGSTEHFFVNAGALFD